MKRFLFALGLLATVAISESEAGYLIIRIVLEGSPAEAVGSGGLSRPGSPMSGPGPRSGPLSGTRPPKAGKGVYGLPGGGKYGQPGPSYGPKTAPGVKSPGPMAPGQFGPGGAAEDPEPEIHDPSQSIYVVIPYTNDIAKRNPFYSKKPERSFNPSWIPSIKHQFGYANLIDDNTGIQIYMDLGPLSPKGARTLHSEIVNKHFVWLQKKTDSQMLFDLVNTALERGFIKDAWKYSDELATLSKESKALSPPALRFLSAYAKVKEAIEKPVRAPSDSQQWKQRIGFVYPGVRVLPTAHYHILYWEGMDAEAKRRGDQLEENLKAFYLTNAMQGVVLPLPEKPLLAILTRSASDVRKLSTALDGMPAVTDGFFSPDFGIVVLSPERLDGVGQSFHRQVQQMYGMGVSRSMLLRGEGPVINDKDDKEETKTAEEVARMQTWAAVERFVEEDAEWAAVSREGSRQLLTAAGVLPPHVALPHWLAEGAANYYHRPRGPVFTQKGTKDYITVALTTGYGIANFARQKQFAELVSHRQFDPAKGRGESRSADPGQIVFNVVTDTYFKAGVLGLDADNPNLPLPHAKKPMPKKEAGFGPEAPPEQEDVHALRRQRVDFLHGKAHATAWALYFYLAKTNPEGLDRYLAELRKMPRDLPLDSLTQLEAFLLAFNLTLEPQGKDGKQPISEFGAAWLRWMKTVPVAGVDVALVDIVPPKQDDAGPRNPRGNQLYRPNRNN